MFVRMWLLLITISLLDQNQAASIPGKLSSLQLLLQNQESQTAPSPSPGIPPQKTSSSSSSSSSSASSESSQSSEGPQPLKNQQNLENTAVELVDSSQESLEIQPPSYTNTTSTSLWFNELVLLGERASVKEGDGESDTGDDSMESQHRPLLMAFHPLLTQPRHRESNLIAEVGGATTDGGVSAEGDVGGAKEEKFEFPQLSDDSTEGGDSLTFDLPGQVYHRDEAELELGL